MAEQENHLRDMIHASARHLDDHEFDEFVGLFAEEGEYRIEVNAPELEHPMTWMAMTCEELRQRLASLSQHEWQIAKTREQTRLVSTDRLAVDGASAESSSTVAVFSTDELGRSQVYAVGRYEDRWRLQKEGWKLTRRTVKLKTRLLETPSPLPI